ncbi:MAG: ABC transporter ATP-binding protein [Fimbriimonadaceae bacterium]|nr:ABC transporter ATP-binding protein [Fimbriimonadaceae bacterium]
MRGIPEPYLVPPKGSPIALLIWVIRSQWTTVFQGVVCDIVWLLGLALTPWAIGQSIDLGIVAGDPGAFLAWLGVVVWLQLQHSLIQGLRDRAGSLNFSRAESRLNQMLTRASTRVTVAADRELNPGGIVTMVTESWAIASLTIGVGSLSSAIIAFVLVAILLLQDSLLLGALVLVCVPVFSLLSFTLVGVIHDRQQSVWQARSQLTTVSTDSVKGLRVLHGIGGEEQFLGRFRESSSRLRVAGRRAATPLATAQALSVLVAGTLVGALTWIGAVMVHSGQLQVGALVAFYGYAGFLTLPVSLINQVMATGVNAHVASKQIIRLLRIEPDWPFASDGFAAKEVDRVGVAEIADPLLLDEVTGLTINRGELLGVVVPDPVFASELVDRIARLCPDAEGSPVRLGGIRLVDLPIGTVRNRVSAVDPVPFLFSGTLREVLDPWLAHDDESIRKAVGAVDASDILGAVESGLDSVVGERGSDLSGGQRQRLGVARSLLREVELLVLHDPTSSVDAPTELRMAEGIRSARLGRSTLVITSSPLVLAGADRVALVSNGRLVAAGRHDELLDTVPQYRAAVLREDAQG